MRIQCNAGFFIIRDEATWEVPRFTNIFGLDLVSFRDFYTFPFLADPPGYSIIGNPFLGVNAIANYEGEPWEVMRENEIVYDFSDGTVKPLLTVQQRAKLKSAGQFYISNGLIVPGSLMDDGTRVTDYSARFIWDSMSFRYGEVISQ